MRLRRFSAVLAVAVVAAAVVPAAASAHATLEGTQPGRGATVAKAPPQVVFRFDETVEGNFGAVRVFNGKGERVDQGDAFHPGGSGPRLGVHLKAHLPPGTYTATYRVVSADSHIVSGGFVFSIGHAGAAPGETVSQLLGKSKTGPVTKIAFGAARALQFAAIGVATGALVFLLVAWLPALRALAGGSAPWRTASEVLVRRVRMLMLVACVTGTLSALAGVVLEAAEAAGVSGFAALRPHILSEVFDTRFGGAWTAASACWVVLGALASVVLRPAARRAPVLHTASLGADGLATADSRRTMAAVLGLPLVVLLLLPAFSGHGSTQSPVPLMFGSITLHVTAMSVWFGGLVALVLALPRATRELDPTERTRLVAGVVSRFSPLALGAVIVLLASGLVQAYVEVRHLHLLTSTNFGVAVLIKFCLLLVLIGFGALNRQRTLPRLRALAREGGPPGQAGVILRRTLRSEVAVIVVVLGVTGALASYAPAIAQYSGPASGTVSVGAKQLQYTLDPARAGSNQLHLYLLDAKTGAQYGGAKQVDVEASLPSKHIGPLQQSAQKSGPGHYTVAGMVLNVPGTWHIKVDVLVDKFDQDTTTLKVPVR